jgi:hypothetical protein
MFLPAQSIASILYDLACRRRGVRIVAVHGMEDPAISLEMADQYENAARIALDRVGAGYALTIPFTFAFYGDLWRANRPGPRGGGLPRALDRLGPFGQLYPLGVLGEPPYAELEMDLALELLAKTNIQLNGAHTYYGLSDPTFMSVFAGLGRHEGGQAEQGALWHFATSIATYLTTPSLRELVLARMVQAIVSGYEEVVLLAHGLGSLICYDLLLRRPDLPVRCLITSGSPLGLEGVRTALAQSIASTGASADTDTGVPILPFPARLPRWINLYNRADIVASAYPLASLYKPMPTNDPRHVEDVDTGKPRPPSPTNLFAGHHPATYLSSKVAGIVLRSVVEQ